MARGNEGRVRGLLARLGRGRLASGPPTSALALAAGAGTAPALSAGAGPLARTSPAPAATQARPLLHEGGYEALGALYALRRPREVDAPLPGGLWRVLGHLDPRSALLGEALDCLAAAADDRPDERGRHHDALRRTGRARAAGPAAALAAALAAAPTPLPAERGGSARCLLLLLDEVEDVVWEADKLDELPADGALFEALESLRAPRREDGVLQPNVHEVVNRGQGAAV
mmetsp:Transcript_64662/g.204397  ORF Transcript_64662/g.204397 Transcript_64662/m.204397 type:complete len:229 (-) Transcript_64662:98-784(-)